MALTDEGIINVPGMASRWVRLANGARAHYVTAGDSGPAIILLHGGIVGSSGTAGWRFMLPFLGENGFRVFAPDRPGFGLADTRERYWPNRGFLSWVDFVDQFADALGLDQFHISGNSQGATSTAYYVVNHPERVTSFALIATAGLIDSMGITERVGGITVGAFDGTPKSMKDLMEPIIYRKTAISDDLLEMRARAANAQDASYKAAAAFNREGSKDPKFAQALNLNGRLDCLSIPAIYLYGQQDVLAPVKNGYNQEDVLPNIQMFYPDECGHQGQTDQPDMFNQVFLEFFRDGKVSRKTAEWANVSKRRPELPGIIGA